MYKSPTSKRDRKPGKKKNKIEKCVYMSESIIMETQVYYSDDVLYVP